MLLERLGLHPCQGKYGQPAWTTGRIPFGGVSVLVPPIAQHPCTCRHRWYSNPSKGPFVKRMAMHLGHFTVISIADNVTTLNSVLPVCQGGHNAQCLKSITILDGVNGPGTTLKGTRGSAMVALSNRETFEPRNRLSKAEMVVACSPVVLRHL